MYDLLNPFTERLNDQGQPDPQIVNFENDPRNLLNTQQFQANPLLAMSSPSGRNSLSSPSGRNTMCPFDKAEMMDKARKWNVKYDGTKKRQDALIFLESVREKADCYGIPRDALPELMPIEWFRNNREEWKSWTHFEESFKVFFATRSMRIQQEFEVQRFSPKQSIN